MSLCSKLKTFINNIMRTPPEPRRSQRKRPQKRNDNRAICMPIPSRALVKPTSQQEETMKQTTGYFHIYKELTNHYSLTQTRELYILRIANDPKIPLQLKSLPLLKLVRQTVEEMMMNDIEIVMWAIYLERFVWKEFSVYLKILMYITSFAIKSYLGCSLEHYQAYLSFKFSNFTICFTKWLEKSKYKLSMAPKDLNKKFIYLSSRIKSHEISLVNYNYTVDEILDMAPPYQHEGSQKIDSQPSSLHSSYFEPTSPCLTYNIEAQEVQSDEEINNGPLLARLDSVFIPNSKIEEPHVHFDCMNGSFGVNNSWMLETLEVNKNLHEDDPLPQLGEQQSLFTFYLSQSLS